MSLASVLCEGHFSPLREVQSSQSGLSPGKVRGISRMPDYRPQPEKRSQARLCAESLPFLQALCLLFGRTTRIHACLPVSQKHYNHRSTEASCGVDVAVEMVKGRRSLIFLSECLPVEYCSQKLLIWVE